MVDDPIKIRRGKRTDFPALLALLPSARHTAPTKTQVRHWRRVASDLRHDFYVAEQEGVVLGMVLVCYIRTLTQERWHALLDIVVSPVNACHIGQKLLAFAKARARKRGCRTLFAWVLDQGEQDRCLPLAQAGFSRAGDVLSCEL
jgi:N-acetylglutamate synthase-like GNAT family acetyltransferase